MRVTLFTGEIGFSEVTIHPYKQKKRSLHIRIERFFVYDAVSLSEN